jgi:hypothetical protein
MLIKIDLEPNQFENLASFITTAAWSSELLTNWDQPLDEDNFLTAPQFVRLVSAKRERGKKDYSVTLEVDEVIDLATESTDHNLRGLIPRSGILALFDVLEIFPTQGKVCRVSK